MLTITLDFWRIGLGLFVLLVSYVLFVATAVVLGTAEVAESYRWMARNAAEYKYPMYSPWAFTQGYWALWVRPWGTVVLWLFLQRKEG